MHARLLPIGCCWVSAQVGSSWIALCFNAAGRLSWPHSRAGSVTTGQRQPPQHPAGCSIGSAVGGWHRCSLRNRQGQGILRMGMLTQQQDTAGRTAALGMRVLVASRRRCSMSSSRSCCCSLLLQDSSALHDSNSIRVHIMLGDRV